MNIQLQPHKVKIFIFIDSYHIGGMHRQVLYLVKHLNKEIFEPIMCTQIPSGGLRSEYEKVGCKLYDLKWKNKFDLSTVYRLVKILEKERPDIIFLTQAQNFLYFKLARLFWHRKIVQIGSFRAMTFWNGHLKTHLKYIDIIISKWFYSSSSYLTVNSNVLNQHYSKILKIKSDKPIKTIYNGSDFNYAITKSAENIRQEMNLSMDDVIIIMVARLDPWKDFITLFEAASIVTNYDKKAKFLLVGNGIIKKNLEKIILEMDLKENVFLVGEKKDIFNYINAADICVLSTNGEGFSNTILESMALCKPIIATNVGGNSELIGLTSESGFLIPPKSPALFADVILSLMKSVELQEKIGQSAEHRIHQLCSIDRYISSYENLFLRSI